MRAARIASWLSCLLVLGGCAPASGPLRTPQLSDTEAGDALEEVGGEALEQLLDARARIKDLEYALTTQAASYCGELSRPRAGALLSDPEKLTDRKIKRVAEQKLALGDGPTIVHVVPEQAGLQTGDVILRVDGEALDSSGRFAQILLQSDQRESLALRIQRGAEERELTVGLEPACPIAFGLSTSAMIVPWQHEKLAIAVPLGLISWSESEDELAVATAHQLAHALFDHPDEPELDSELRADRLGMKIAAGAGYDVSGAPRYWERVAVEYPWLVLPKPTARRTITGSSTWSVALGEYPHHEIGARLPQIRTLAQALVPRD